MRISVLWVGSLLGSGFLCGCFSSSSGGGGTANFDGGTIEASFPDGASHDSSVPETGGETGTIMGTLSTAPVDFGPAPCGSAPASKSYTFQNTGPIPIVWSASVDSIFTITPPTSGTVAPGQSGTLTVTASAVPVTSDPSVPITGTLSLTTNVPGYTSIQVPLTVEPQGGSLSSSLTPIAFGTTELTTPATLSFSLKNLGNQPVTVTFGTPTDNEFALSYTGSPGMVTIAPGATLPQASATFSPQSAGQKTATIAIQTTDAVCASATSLSLNGTGTTAPVSVGPGSLQFGAVACGTTASTQTTTIRNGYSSAVAYTATLGLGAASPYSLSSTAGNVPALGQTTITVTPAPIPVNGNTSAGAYDDTLTIATPGVPGSQPTVVQLTESASGAILALQMPTTGFGMVTGQTTLPFTVTNTGNLAAPLTLVTTGPGFNAGFPGLTVAQPGGAAVPGVAGFTPTQGGMVTGTLSVTTTVAQCAPPPMAVALSATGEIPVASFSNDTLDVAYLFCQANQQATLTITNNGNDALTISNVGSGNVNGNTGQPAAFVVESAVTSIPPGQSGTIVIGPTDPGGSESGTFLDTLLFTTNEPGSPSHSVPVSNFVNDDC
jgi:hypothetical protein